MSSFGRAPTAPREELPDITKPIPRPTEIGLLLEDVFEHCGGVKEKAPSPDIDEGQGVAYNSTQGRSMLPADGLGFSPPQRTVYLKRQLAVGGS